jgi:hypothetical protein
MQLKQPKRPLSLPAVLYITKEETEDNDSTLAVLMSLYVRRSLSK